MVDTCDKYQGAAVTQLRALSIMASLIDETEDLYQFDREYHSVRKTGSGRASESPFACILESCWPARNGVQAEGSEFIVRALTPFAAGLKKNLAGGAGR
jgi:hypothetical protein